MRNSMITKILIVSLLVFVILAASVPGLAAGAKYNWKLASVLPDSHPVNKALVYFAERVGILSKGQIKITVFANGQLGQESDYLQQCSIGSIEITKISASAASQYIPQLDATGMPFIWRNAEHQFKALDGKVGKMLNAFSEQKGFKMLSYMDAGFRSFTMRDKPVKTPADLKGMKVRTQQSKLMLDVVAAFGATAVPMGMSDVYTALQAKVIDGWENNEPTVLTYNMQEVCKYYSYTRHTSVPDVLIMNLKTFNSLPKNLQKTVMTAAGEATISQRQIWADMIGTTVDQLKAKGCIMNEVDDIKAFQAIVEPAIKSYVATSKVSADLNTLIKAIQETK
ncbi:MAG TPA: TRAP transporter substrate-binding protein [Bacillota bacterium]|nr:TRAP transporter substrate-binding protein [Bacillota bacterium]